MADRDLLNELLTALPLPTLAITRDERIVAINEAAQALFAIDALGRHFITVLRQPPLVEAVERSLRDRQMREASFLVGAVGRELTFNVSVRPVGDTGTLIISFQDITHEAEAGEMRRDFVANVSHELRTPLTALMGFIETLSGPAKDDEEARARFLGIMSGEAERMNRLVGDLLSLSRVEAEARVRPSEEVNLTDVLQTALRNLNPLAVDSDVTLRPDFGDQPMKLRGDADQLLQVFTNLIENAIKYGGEGKTVDITGSFDAQDRSLRGPAVRITVKDQGPGIEAMHLPRLTERFYRADNHRSRALGGTGLGLAIVKHILNRHRGRLTVSSTPPDGASFTVVLPAESVGSS